MASRTFRVKLFGLTNFRSSVINLVNFRSNVIRNSEFESSLVQSRTLYFLASVGVHSKISGFSCNSLASSGQYMIMSATVHGRRQHSVATCLLTRRHRPSASNRFLAACCCKSFGNIFSVKKWGLCCGLSIICPIYEDAPGLRSHSIIDTDPFFWTMLTCPLSIAQCFVYD